jgi:hypothetical protein
VLSRFFARLAISLAVMLIALVAAIIAMTYFAYALYLLLLDWVVPPAAAVLTGVIVLLAVALLALVTRGASRPRRMRAAGMPTLEACEDAAGLGTEMGRKIRGLAGAQASGGLMAALVAGFAVGVSPKLRAFLQALLKP